MYRESAGPCGGRRGGGGQGEYQLDACTPPGANLNVGPTGNTGTPPKHVFGGPFRRPPPPAGAQKLLTDASNLTAVLAEPARLKSSGFPARNQRPGAEGSSSPVYSTLVAEPPSRLTARPVARHARTSQFAGGARPKLGSPAQPEHGHPRQRRQRSRVSAPRARPARPARCAGIVASHLSAAAGGARRGVAGSADRRRGGVAGAGGPIFASAPRQGARSTSCVFGASSVADTNSIASRPDGSRGSRPSAGDLPSSSS